ncbi:HAMP domain-containing protein [Bowmanella sp. Y26]|uniref:methyl-accepting chemotaxis protein n=1 Tax=Bowmanella yangjiangensis TaxID=2811230 RepID=UPI001BDBFCCC|nr:methyl-accepting chemotaxis protein [Bowmanella yangjiangensis]MBT1065523.1 HAMP domain-containing protein [Bowmanella yangjiangensis]
MSAPKAGPLSNLSITLKSMISPSLILLFMALVGIFAYLELNKINTSVQGITQDLAPDSGTASTMMRQIYRKRMQVKDYFSTGTQATIDRFKQEDATLQSLIAKAQADIQNPQRVAMISDLVKMNDQYNKIFFEQVVSNMQRRQTLVANTIVPVGKSIESSLNTILDAEEQGNNQQQFRAVSTGYTRLISAKYNLFMFLNDNQKNSFSAALADIEQAMVSLQTVKPDSVPESQRRALKQALADISDYRQAIEQTASAIDLRSQAIESLNALGPQLASKAVSLSDSVFSSLIDEGNKTEITIQTTTLTIALLTLVAIVVGLSLAYFITKGVIRPILKANEVLRDIAEGEGDLTQRLPVMSNDELGQMSESFNLFVEKMQSTVTQISSATLQLAAAAEEMSQVTEQSSANVSEQRNETEQVAAAINEMTATVREVAQNAEQASQAANDANSQSQSGNQTVALTLQTINQLAKDVDDSAQVILRLQGQTENIGSVLEIIKNIAEQTNLLALNAAIEAARAGDQGRGFAVVADEVRTLAKRTHDSTEEIEELIKVLQSGAENAVKAMEQSKQRAGNTVEQAQQAGQALDAITQSVDTISQMNIQIAAAAEQQIAVVEDINRNVHNIHGLSEQNAVSAAQTSNSSQELARLGEDLQRLVSQFKV